MMTRITLTDGTGRWYNAETAYPYMEGTTHDGSNFISKATGSQWNHEALIHTKGRLWVLNCFSQWQGSTETYEEISARDAARWMVENGHTDVGCLKDEIAALEI